MARDGLLEREVDNATRGYWPENSLGCLVLAWLVAACHTMALESAQAFHCNLPTVGMRP